MTATIAPSTTTGGMPLAGRWPLTGAALVASAVLAAVGAVILGSAFGWPAVLDEPGTTALPKFAGAETAIRAGFLLELLSSLLLVPAAYGIREAVGRDSRAAQVLTTFGVAGAMFQIMGWVRWPVVVPGLSDRYADSSASESARTATAAAYDVLNAYAGGALGEHLGWLFQAPWAVGVGVLVLGARGLPRWFGALGAGLAAVWAVLIVPEPYLPVLSGDAVSGLAFAVYSVWFIWLAALGVLLAVRRVQPGDRGSLAT